MKEIAGQLGTTVIAIFVCIALVAIIGSWKGGNVLNAVQTMIAEEHEIGCLGTNDKMTSSEMEMFRYQKSAGIQVELSQPFLCQEENLLSDALSVKDRKGHRIEIADVFICDSQGNQIYTEERLQGTVVQFEEPGIYEIVLYANDLNGSLQCAYLKIPVQAKGDY